MSAGEARGGREAPSPAPRSEVWRRLWDLLLAEEGDDPESEAEAEEPVTDDEAAGAEHRRLPKA